MQPNPHMLHVVGQRTGKKYFLGRKPKTFGKPTLKLEPYFEDLEAIAASLPPALDLTPKAKDVIKLMLGNDQYGDCVMADVGHTFGIWTANRTGNPEIPTLQEILNAYKTICGPGDNGCVIDEVSDYYRDHGIMLGGKLRKIRGYVAIDWTNADLVKAAVFIFGANHLGINLPSAWTGDVEEWDVTNARSVGGHDVPTFGWNDRGFIIATWGGLRTITYPAYKSKKWLDECSVRLSDDWTGNQLLTPLGIKVAELEADLQAIADGRIPDINPDNLLDWGVTV